MKDEEWHVRYHAAEALGQIGPEAKAAVPALIQALKDEDRDVGQSEAEALEKINIEAEATEDAAFDFWYLGLVQKPPIFEAHFGHYLARFECWCGRVYNEANTII